jgi:hypothetical protein
VSDPEDSSFAADRAKTYRAHAEEMLKCAARARMDDERIEYLKLAKAWVELAVGAERGLKTDEACEETDGA